MMTMMVVSLLNPQDSDEMNRALMLTLSLISEDVTQTQLQSIVTEIKRSNHIKPDSHLIVLF